MHNAHTVESMQNEGDISQEVIKHFDAYFPQISTCRRLRGLRQEATDLIH